MEIAAQMKLCCNLKTIYQRQFGVTPIGAIRSSRTPRNKEDFQLKENISKASIKQNEKDKVVMYY